MSVISYKTPDGKASLEFSYADEVLKVNGHSYPASTSYVWIDGKKTPFWVHRAKESLSVWLDGEVFNVTILDPRQRSSENRDSDDTSGVIKAQMPGKILKVSVAPEQIVSKGQNLLVMESMKMELSIDAPIEGRIASLEVSAGQLVSQNDPLVKIDTASK